ncbi:MAG: PD40 domain-containing protein, partial [Deltaproteobacteria bacterium]|nr:PD40 domain-containing protein [Deltaproteobacteria bacterium]
MQNKKVLSEDLLRFQIVSDPRINSAGTSILFSKRMVNSKNKTVSHLFTVDLNHKITQWTQGESVNTFGRWSPDGSNVAFISMREEKKFQIYLISTSGGEAKKATDLPDGVLSYFKWSPDSKKIAFIFREGLQEFTEKAKKEREEKGLSQPPFITETGWHRLDGEGYFGHARNAIYCLDIQTNKYNKIYDHCKMGFYSLDWLSDSQSLLVSHSVQPNPLGKKIDDRIFRVYLDGKSEELRGLPKGRKAEVLCSPDGAWFSYLGNEDELDHFGSKNLNLYLSDFS